jgi:hypothetical protein
MRWLNAGISALVAFVFIRLFDLPLFYAACVFLGVSRSSPRSFTEVKNSTGQVMPSGVTRVASTPRVGTAVVAHRRLPSVSLEGSQWSI